MTGCCKKSIPFKIKRLVPEARLPFKATPGASGFDLSAAEPAVVKPGETVMVSTGLSMQVPSGYEVQIRPRSGLAAKKGITVLNTPGTIDSDYRSTVRVLLHNTGYVDFAVEVGDRIAQAVVMEVPVVELVEVNDLDETQRGAGGFGSTGVK